MLYKTDRVLNDKTKLIQFSSAHDVLTSTLGHVLNSMALACLELCDTDRQTDRHMTAPFLNLFEKKMNGMDSHSYDFPGRATTVKSTKV